jgi:hypothetical protein
VVSKSAAVKTAAAPAVLLAIDTSSGDRQHSEGLDVVDEARSSVIRRRMRGRRTSTITSSGASAVVKGVSKKSSGAITLGPPGPASNLCFEEQTDHAPLGAGVGVRDAPAERAAVLIG